MTFDWTPRRVASLAQHELSRSGLPERRQLGRPTPKYEGYSDAERAAIEYTEKFATDHLAIDQALIDRLVEIYGEDLLMDMKHLHRLLDRQIGRLNEVFGAEVSCPVRL